MIRFSKIDAELSIYRKKDVFLFGASSAGKKAKKLLGKFGIGIKAVIDNDIQKAGKEFFGVKIISFNELKEIINDYCIIQIASVHEKEIEEDLKAINADYILYSEFIFRMNELARYQFCKKYPDLKSYMYEVLWTDIVNLNLKISSKYLLETVFEDADFINIKIAPPKTGNVSLGKSIDGKIFNQMHTYAYIPKTLEDFLKDKKVNIIMGVRDIISQHLSLLFQNASDATYFDLDEFWVDGGDVQKVFDRFFVSDDKQDCWYNYISLKEGVRGGGKVEDFFDLQFKPFWGVDIYEYPFDKEKGYSIYHEGNLNIMVYQLEKMSILEKEIGDFLQLKEFKLIKANDSDNKWYMNTYEKAKKELRLTKKYFDRCYNSKYMKHFYSDDDIKEFQEMWQRNLF
ncbi:hypothetical protein D7V86_01940 [bacterium D16-51]|nr:hypothetical protein D7V96_01365 [bacterium D16-59]RKI62301.1 hypothetical protein D7V86_01940 [bacterium D16-51]